MTAPHPDPASLREELREKIARCIEPEYFSLYEAGGPNKERDGQACDSARKRAGTILAALSSHLASAGWRVVPMGSLSRDKALELARQAGRQIPNGPLAGTLMHSEGAHASDLALAVNLILELHNTASPDPLAPADRSTGETDD